MFNLANITSHTTTTSFIHSSGPRSGVKLAIVGEVWGKQEALVGQPFIGSAGQDLTQLLKDTGIARSSCFFTNVFPLQPQNNDIESICVKKAEAQAETLPLRQGVYIHPHLLPEVERLKAELQTVQPNLTIALGSVASWALLSRPAITSVRGTIAHDTLGLGLKILPTYHPSAVLRNWALRVIVRADLLKAKRELEFPDIRRPERQVLINPTLEEIHEWARRPALAYAVDIETWKGQITMIGFARSASDAIVIPFVEPEFRDYCYWREAPSETTAWLAVRDLLQSPIPKIFQNGLYDMGYLLRLGFRVNAATDDTMLMHHSLYPELQKGLGFLGSIYSNEASWKLMRKRSGDIVVKADE